MWKTISQAITDHTDQPFLLENKQAVNGGCISEAICIDDGKRTYFVKLNQSVRLGMFEAEASGLQAIINTYTIKAPGPLCWGVAGDHAYLVLEHLPLSSHKKTGGYLLGAGLGKLHRHTGPSFGWPTNNTIGSTPQINTPLSSWASFWRERRLGYQLALASKNGYTGTLQVQGERLMSGLDTFLAGHSPAASLLHGDLWSGNYAITTDGAPVIFDPACYYGDRESDLAMTELFGGFPPDFYQGYRDHYPLEPGYEKRKHLYNLYHVLNHLNLFGETYLNQALLLIQKCLKNQG